MVFEVQAKKMRWYGGTWAQELVKIATVRPESLNDFFQVLQLLYHQ